MEESTHANAAGDAKPLVVRIAQMPAAAFEQREEALLAELNAHGLPSEGIFIEIEQRAVVFKNLDTVVALLEEERRGSSTYISKFIAAVTSGLFDAALNYLWDETVAELRRRVSSYDLSYFYDHAIKNEDRRKQFRTEAELSKVEDQELINAAREIELISEIGYRQLDEIRFMRNSASAAHPNENPIDGLTLIGYLNTCIKQVIAYPFSPNVTKIKRLLANIKAEALSGEQANETSAFFLELTQDQTNALAQGFFGIYTRTDSDAIARNNIKKLLPPLWPRVDEETRRGFGVKYAQFVANSQHAERQYAREFLDLVNGQAYAPDNVRLANIATTLQNLINAHRAINNFYNEPVFARELERVVGETPNIPREIQTDYVVALVETFLTNGNGVAWNAEEVYQRLIRKFTSREANIASVSFIQKQIASKLRFSLCSQKFLEILDLIEPITSSPAVKELIRDIRAYRGKRDEMREDVALRRKIDAVSIILG